jgi:hypothetical protein
VVHEDTKKDELFFFVPSCSTSAGTPQRYEEHHEDAKARRKKSYGAFSSCLRAFVVSTSAGKHRRDTKNTTKTRSTRRETLWGSSSCLRAFVVTSYLDAYTNGGDYTGPNFQHIVFHFNTNGTISWRRSVQGTAGFSQGVAHTITCPPI